MNETPLYLVFKATKLKQNFKIPSTFLDSVPAFRHLTKFNGNRRDNHLTYTYDQDLSVRAMKAYCEIKQCQKVKSLNEDIFEEDKMNTMDWIYLLNLICILGDFTLLDGEDDGTSTFDITRYMPSLYTVYPFLDKMEPEIFSRYTEDYIYDIFIRDKEDDIMSQYKGESSEFKLWLKVMVQRVCKHELEWCLVYDWINQITRLVERMNDLCYSGSPSIVDKVLYESVLEETVWESFTIQWKTMPINKRRFYSKIVFKEYTLGLVEAYDLSRPLSMKRFEESLALPKSNFKKDFTTFFSCLPDMAHILWSTPEYKEQLLRYVSIPNKKLKFVKGANYDEMIDFLTKDAVTPIIDEKERQLRLNLWGARDEQKSLQRKGYYFPNDTESVVKARVQLDAYMKSKQKSEQQSRKLNSTTTTTMVTTNNFIYYKRTFPIRIKPCKK